SSLREAGISPIVVVTGYMKEDLEKHLVHRNVTFVHNADYEHSQMLDSIKLGLKALMGTCHRALLIPADMPMFSVHTLNTVAGTTGDVVIPAHKGIPGHPVLVNLGIAEKIIKYKGEKGLRGAMGEGRLKVVQTEVNDPGILIEANTKKDHHDIIDYERDRLMATPVYTQIEPVICRNKPFLNRETVEFLKEIELCGSMNAACKKMKIAYSRGWTMVNTAETQSGIFFLSRKTGGSGGGSSALTPEGKAYMDKFEQLSLELEIAAGEIFRRIFPSEEKQK
ncbi:MAG: NTP transferase domain-containing protein, partial [Anaerovoracaceae bacterium]